MNYPYIRYNGVSDSCNPTLATGLQMTINMKNKALAKLTYIDFMEHFGTNQNIIEIEYICIPESKCPLTAYFI